MKGVLPVRKTLVIGLGSTGLRVAEQLAEHLNWQYGSFERAAWVRLLVLETAQPHSILGDRVMWGGMTREEYLPYLNSPRTSGAEFGFYEWQDGPTLRDINNPADGAGNSRMLGRLCLFHPRTYEGLRRRVTEDLAYLERLTPQNIADSLGEAGLTVKIHEGGTVVYVVGTLCGGTGSGGCSDLGYLTAVWSKDRARRQAIFTIPHPGFSHALSRRYKKNAYYALKELNYYQLDNTLWKQKLPEFLNPEVRSERPYDICRVVMPQGPSGEDVQRLNAMIGQYLAAAVGPAGFEIAASDVDAFGKMEGSESIGFMRPLFSTMGVAALEYPGEHIQRAATNRLLAGAYGRWCRHRTDSDEFSAALQLLGGTDFDALLQRLTQGADQVSTHLFQEAFKPMAEGAVPKVEQIRQLLREVDTRFTAQETALTGTVTPPAAGASSLPTLAQIIQNNHARLLESIRRDVDRFLEQYLFSLSGGPGLISAVTRQFLADLEQWSEKAQTALPEQRQDAEMMRDILNRQLDEIEKVQNNPLVWNKRDRLRQSWETASGQINSYLNTELRIQAATHVQRKDVIREMVDQYRKLTAPLLRRLDQIQAAFGQEATELEGAWKELAAQSPSVNGKVYFDAEPPSPRGTVTEEYYKLLRQQRWPDEPATGWDDAQKEAAAMREVLRALDSLRQELTRDDGQAAFDPRPGIQSARDMIPGDLRAAAETRARAMFTPLREQVHIADKAADADLDTVVQSSEPRLGVSAAQVSDQLAGVRGANPMQSYLAFMDTGSGEGQRPSIARVEQRVRNSMELRRGGLIDSDDPFRLLIIREKHGFTLGQMEGVVRANQYDNHALQSAEGDTDFKFWHTRRDVDWIDALVPPSQVEATEEAWLLTLLLGRPADEALPWLPSTRGEIPSEGWYQIVSGEFYVFYATGTDATERGATLPLPFPAAVAKLLLPDYTLLRRTLAMRFSTYCDTQGHAHVIRLIDQAVKSLTIFGVTDLDLRKADRILRRAYRRNDALTRSFFEFRTEGLQNPAEFAHLRRLQGMPIEGRSAEFYPTDGYYCPRCHGWLGGDIQKLLDAQFRCPACNLDERYWP